MPRDQFIISITKVAKLRQRYAQNDKKFAKKNQIVLKNEFSDDLDSYSLGSL